MKLGHEASESRARWPSLTSELMAELQNWAAEHSLPAVPEEQLAIFAHSCYYNREATLRCMETYYRLRANAPEFFCTRDPLLEDVQSTLKALNYCRLPRPDKDGNIVVFHSLRDTNPSAYVFNTAVKVLFMMMDACLYHDGCTPGYVFLFDMKGVRISHLTRLSITGIRRFFEYLQEANPVRLKAIHVINCVWFIDKVLALIRPFMKKELMDILHLHSGDVSLVYQHIPPECLPKDFGGQLDDVETYHAENGRKMVELRDYFLEEEQLYRSYRSVSNKNRLSCSDTVSSHHNGNSDGS
ncbi:alpha-tocopherol transfer protein-like [Copidosoma floridanum]|uniref:alpha-tocopherol transfer protein-like n=1 Tax=Copidosoma floridanum TaxID=29053 RepID=UPI000C6FBA7B|nr:alpha-tocopherol transfer protein-like [Copidosoma floridanum]